MADSLAVAELKYHIRNFSRGLAMPLDPDAALQLSKVVRYVERLEKIAEAANLAAIADEKEAK